MTQPAPPAAAPQRPAMALSTRSNEATPQSQLQHDVEPMTLERAQALNEDDLTAAVELAIHLGRATRAVQLTVGAALTYRRQRMQGRQWPVYLQERCGEWGRSERTLQRWMEASQAHYGIEAPKGAQERQRGKVRTPVIPRGGGKRKGTTAAATKRPANLGPLAPRGPQGTAGNAGGVLADRALLSTEITPTEAASRLIGADPGEMSVEAWRMVRHAAEEAITTLIGATSPAPTRHRPEAAYPDPSASVIQPRSCAHPKAERVVRNGGIVACGACGAIRRPSGAWV